VGPTPTDPVEFRECARDVRTWSAAKKHTNEEQGGSPDPGVRRPGAGRGQLPARSKIFRAAMHKVIFCVLGWLPPANRKRSAVQRPETVGTHLMFCAYVA